MVQDRCWLSSHYATIVAITTSDSMIIRGNKPKIKYKKPRNRDIHKDQAANKH